MATSIMSKTTCDNHIHCGQTIEHVYKWPPGWGHLSLMTRDVEGYVTSQPIDLDLCPRCLTAVERAIGLALKKETK